jgi:hypothetical protein
VEVLPGGSGLVDWGDLRFVSVVAADWFEVKYEVCGDDVGNEHVTGGQKRTQSEAIELCKGVVITPQKQKNKPDVF